MRCPKCSTDVPERESRCPACGTQIPPTDISTASEAHVPVSDASLDFPPGTRFADRFTLIERAGQGGMGVVYKAIDTSLDQVVALKLIRPELAGSRRFVERFRQEVKLTRQISHPNVCRVHDLGESGGRFFLSMEWVEGQTLRQLLQQTGALARDRALEIAEDIAHALGAAHARSIVHRDLKPSNVMIDRLGSTHVMDFGIAAGPESVSDPTSASASGTPAYMSPEQKRGEKPDARADLYSLGLILREMLTGIAADPRVPPFSEQLETVPRSVEPLLKSLLAERPADRCPSAQAAIQSLRRIRGVSGVRLPRWIGSLTRPPRRQAALGWGVVALLVALGIYAALRPRPGGEEGRPPAPTETSPARAYYDTALYYLGEEAETVRSLDDAIHMLHRAIEKEPGFAEAWAHLGAAYWIRYERTREASSRDEAIRAVQKALQIDPNLPEAQYAIGRGLIAEGKYEEAKAALEKAVKRKKDFDVAWANLGTVYQELDDYANALRALQNALKLNPRSFRNQIYLGLLYYHFGEHNRAVQAYQTALSLKPHSAIAWENLGAAYLQMGQLDQAIDALRKCLEIEKRPSALSNLGTVYYYQGKYEEAAGSYREATALEPKEADLWGNLGDALRMLHRDEEARTAYRQAVGRARENVALVPNDPKAHLTLGLYCARVRDEPCALKEGNLGAQLQPESSETLFRIAVIHCIFGRMNDALDWLEKAVRLGLTRVQIQNEPDLAPLKGNPRFQKILELAS
jgi:serine/threonine protein kinase